MLECPQAILTDTVDSQLAKNLEVMTNMIEGITIIMIINHHHHDHHHFIYHDHDPGEEEESSRPSRQEGGA